DIYRNHCLRVFNFTKALAGESWDAPEKTAVAAYFHDYGIWAERTFDYLLPSQKHAARYLREKGLEGWIDEITEVIEWHHKITPYKANPSWLVEPFRKADWIDITGGMLRFRLPDGFVTDVMDAFPIDGFHKMLVKLTVARLKSHPFNPLPMMKL
ncbi:MAG: HD domain-containing protein, partial [Chlorobiaceae bacterium]|nr:HD domain-containing protein [Chlorobiaceae bacterium]